MSEKDRSRPARSQPTPKPKRFKVWDENAKRYVQFDESKTTKWWATESDLDSYGALAADFDERVEECLYRHESGEWTLISLHIHLDWGQHKTTAKRLNDSQAAEWLALNGHDLPDDIAEIGSEFLFEPKAPTAEAQGLLKPKWDRENRELRYGDVLCKKFKQKAENQTAILNAFEEDGWPPRIDDPLTGKPDTDHQQRVADTVRRLNQNSGGIKFERDGETTGILWHPPESSCTQTPGDEVST